MRLIKTNKTIKIMTKVKTNQELTNVEFLRSLTEEQKEWMLKNGVWKESESKEKIIAIQK